MGLKMPKDSSKAKRVIDPVGKKCSACKKFKKYEEFSKNKTCRDGRNNQCGKCMYKYQKKNKTIGFQEYVPQTGEFFQHQKLATI